MPPEFEELIQQHHLRIRRIARRYAPPGGVDDLYQEILIQLWRGIKNFRGTAKVETWLYRIAFNTAMTHIRIRLSKSRDERAITTEEIPDQLVPGERCHAEILTQFLNLLNKVDASVLIMHLDGLEAHDIADILGISANAVAIRINRIKRKFSDIYID